MITEKIDQKVKKLEKIGSVLLFISDLVLGAELVTHYENGDVETIVSVQDANPDIANMSFEQKLERISELLDDIDSQMALFSRKES